MNSIVAYVSGHGFGHATRTAEVLRAVRRLDPEVAIAIVSSAPEDLFRTAIPGGFEFRHLVCDVGVAQHGALTVDAAGTVERWRDFVAGWDTLVDREAARLRSARAPVVMADIPPLAFAAAHRAGVPGVGLANFSWDWIYRGLSSRASPLQAAAEHCAAAYRTAALLLRLPFAGDLSAFPRIEDVPLVARRPRVPRAEARRRIGLDTRAVVLLSFGGLGLPGFSPSVLAPESCFQFLVPDAEGALPANVGSAHAARLRALALAYEDVVGAADVVVTKPGYGIVSDAIGARTRMIYTDRGDFAEYPILVAGLERWLPAVYVTNDEVRQGRLRAAVEQVLARALPDEPDLSGADVAARRILEIARNGIQGRVQ